MYEGGFPLRAKRVWRDVHIALSPTADFKNEWSCTSSPSIRLLHLNRENLNFFKFLINFSAVRPFCCKFDRSSVLVFVFEYNYTAVNVIIRKKVHDRRCNGMRTDFK
jgi:hypothetical protein